ARDHASHPQPPPRITGLPLVSSTYDLVSAAYSAHKEQHPYLHSVCGVAERGVLGLAAVAVSSAQPLLTRLEPQIATANEYACRGLDKLEEKLPFLHQPSEKVLRVDLQGACVPRVGHGGGGRTR
uniref:Perilipin-5 n=1 Tax=Ornithorhynchus anatinus TaxID=9258 RepID=A0A6I8N245_ORNAN